MSFFNKITSKPWLHDPDAFAGDSGESVPGDRAEIQKTKRMGLFIFIGVATALFGLFTIAYYMRMMLGGWQMLSEPWILWPNTLVLLAGSLVMQWAMHLGRRGEMVLAGRAFIAGGVAGILFLVGQLIAWREIIALGLYASVNPANAFFYLITGLHGLHLLGGLVAWLMVLLKTVNGATAAEVTASIELCGYYWHFMLLVWVGLFLLLLAT